MTTLARAELERSLQKGTVAPLYLLVGPEGYLREAAATQLINAALSDALLRDFNFASFNLLTQSSVEAVAAAEQFPMMSSRRVIKISNFGRLREADEVPLANYLARPNESSVVIFTAAELDKRKKLTKALIDSCIVVEFPALHFGEAKNWVKSRLSQLNLTIDGQALDELLDLIGTDVQTLNSEVEKLSSAVANNGHISRETVAELTGRTRELSNFELGDHILARNRKRALETLVRLLEGGSEPVMLIGLIASNYHRLALAKDLYTRGSRDDLFRIINVPSFKRNEFIARLQRTEAARITRGIQLIAAADLAIKTSQATPRLQLEMLVCELAN